MRISPSSRASIVIRLPHNKFIPTIAVPWDSTTTTSRGSSCQLALPKYVFITETSPSAKVNLRCPIGFSCRRRMVGMGRDTSPLKPVSRTAATGTKRPNPSKTSNRIIGVLSAVTRPLIMDCRPSRKPDVGRRIADTNRPGHGTGTSVEEAAGGIRITFAYLVVAGVDIYDHEFSMLSGLNQRPNSLLVDCRATGRKVCGYPLNRTDTHAVMLTRPGPGVTAPNQRSTYACITEARIGHPEQQWYITSAGGEFPMNNHNKSAADVRAEIRTGAFAQGSPRASRPAPHRRTSPFFPRSTPSTSSSSANVTANPAH